MRHLFSLLAGLIIAPATWVLVGLSQAKFAKATSGSEGFTLGDLTTPLVLLAAAGLVFGLIAATRISPVGPMFGGLLFLGGQTMYVWRPMTVTDVLPAKVFGEAGVLTMPASTGVALILGAALLTSLFSIGRWRRWPRFGDPDDAFLNEGAAPIGSPTPAGARQTYGNAFGEEPTMPAGHPSAHMRGNPPGMAEEPAHAFSGAPPVSDQPRYEAFGYVSDEPTRSTSGGAWPEPPEPAWRTHGDLDDRESERTHRLPGSGGGMGSDPGPWSEPPRRL